jgi:hypothetical protein
MHSLFTTGKQRSQREWDASAAGLTQATWISLLDWAVLTGGIQLGDVVTILVLWALAMAFMLTPPVIPAASVLFTRMLKKAR